MKPDVHYARNGNVALAYQVIGDAPTDMIVVIGYLSNLEYAWEIPSMAAFLRRLARSRRLILMDRRGSGLSDPFPVGEAPPLETLMDDIRVVLDAAGSARTAFFGIWDGGMLATLFAATYPDRVTSLILFSSAPAGAVEEDFPWSWDDERWEEWLASVREGWGTRAWTVANARWQSPSLMKDPEELERWIAFSRLSASPSSAEAVLRIEKDTDLRQMLPAVRVPTLVLHRSGDQAQLIEGGRYISEKIPGARFVELPGDDAIPWVGDTDSILDEIERFLAGPGPQTPEDRVLATVLFTDIVNSTARSAEIGDDRWREVREQHDRIIRARLADHRGREVKTMGDGFLATFDGPARAVRCARAITEDVHALSIEVRAGLHTGEIEPDGDDVAGIAVAIAARVSALAGPSEVLVSSTVKDLTAGSGLTFEDTGEHELKGVPDRWHLYRVVG